MKINLNTTICNNTGYDSHGRGLLQGLHDAGADVSAETMLPILWDRNPNLNETMINLLRKPLQFREATIMIAQPPFWKLKLSDRPKKFYGCLVFEGDKISESWAADCNDERVDGIFVPSHHVRKAAEAAGVKKPLFVVPHGVDLQTFKPGSVGENFKPLENRNVCNFLFSKGWANGVNDRSGFDLLARAFNEEFGKEESVRLLVNINKIYCPQGWDFGIEVQKLCLKEDRAPMVYFNSQFGLQQLPDLYRLSDFIVSCSKGEAFNLPVLEGMACGLVPIVPDNGGEQDYVLNGVNGIVYHADELVPAQGGFMYEETVWASLKVEDLRKVLRQAFELWKDQKNFKLMKEGALMTAQGLSWKYSAEQVLKVVEK